VGPAGACVAGVVPRAPKLLQGPTGACSAVLQEQARHWRMWDRSLVGVQLLLGFVTPLSLLVIWEFKEMFWATLLMGTSLELLKRFGTLQISSSPHLQDQQLLVSRLVYDSASKSPGGEEQ
jgi:hypothetical protein